MTLVYDMIYAWKGNIKQHYETARSSKTFFIFTQCLKCLPSEDKTSGMFDAFKSMISTDMMTFHEQKYENWDKGCDRGSPNIETATSLDGTEITCVWRGKNAMGSGLWREGSGLNFFSKNDQVFILFFWGVGGKSRYISWNLNHPSKTKYFQFGEIHI